MTQIQDEQALAPCPWCGSQAAWEGGTQVVCKGCSANLIKTMCSTDDTEAVMIKAWNTRSLPALIAAAKGMGYAVVPVEDPDGGVLVGCVYYGPAGAYTVDLETLTESQGD